MPEKARGVGVCTEGEWLCDEEGELSECVNFGVPSAERCDGKDNNCDGTTDEGHGNAFSTSFDYYFPGQVNPCPGIMGACANSLASCDDGAWVCVHASGYEGDETRCDAIDNDCDGLTDEDLFLGETCYTGTVGTERFFPCHPGALVCDGGRPTCVNQRVDEPEICDEVDNDCNGYVDDIEGCLFRDVVLGIDNSGSMGDLLQDIRGAISRLRDIGGDCVRWAVVIVSVGPDEPFYELSLNFGSLDDLQRWSQRLTWGGGMENTIDAMAAVLERRNELGLSWRDEAEGIYISLSDEPPHSYVKGIEDFGYLDGMIKMAVPHHFGWSNMDEWERVVRSAGGDGLYDLGMGPENIAAQIMNIIGTVCE